MYLKKYIINVLYYNSEFWNKTKFVDFMYELKIKINPTGKNSVFEKLLLRTCNSLTMLVGL